MDEQTKDHHNTQATTPGRGRLGAVLRWRWLDGGIGGLLAWAVVICVPAAAAALWTTVRVSGEGEFLGRDMLQWIVRAAGSIGVAVAALLVLLVQARRKKRRRANGDAVDEPTRSGHPRAALSRSDRAAERRRERQDPGLSSPSEPVSTASGEA